MIIIIDFHLLHYTKLGIRISISLVVLVMLFVFFKNMYA